MTTNGSVDSYPRIGCMCSAGIIPRRDTNRNGTAKRSSHRVYHAGHHDRLALRFSIGSRKSHRLVARCIVRPMDS